MNFKNKPNHCISTENGQVWVSRSVAVVVTTLLRCNDELYALMIKRGESVHASGKWCMPCGYLDWDETASECAVREIWEESGLDVLGLSKSEIEHNGLHNVWDLNTNPDLNDSQDVALHYSIIISSDNFPKLSDENAEENEVVGLAWVKLSELGEYNLAFRHDERIKKFLDYYEKIKVK
jgi:8-oxo-dGTP pyrophosphatase MutT (NUDIX family)